MDRVRLQTPCVEYAGTKNEKGYGVLSVPVNGSRLAHRAALAEKLGRPVEGVTRHLCHNPPCIAREHLAEGSQAENMADSKEAGRLRGRLSGRTTCAQGHPLEGDNVRVKAYSDGRVERACITCLHRRNSELAQRRKAARHADGRALGPASECAQGHPMSGNNLIVEPRSTGGIKRACRTCRNNYRAQYRAQEKE